MRDGSDWWNGLIELLFPLLCCGCQRKLTPRATAASGLCVPCRRALPWLEAGSCTQCQARPPLPPTARCLPCQRSASPLSSCTAAVHYEGAVEVWIGRFKYPAAGLAGLDPSALAMARVLARAAANRAPRARPDLVVPVPLHPRRFAARGFNPAAVAARDIAAWAGLACAPGLLRRRRDTPSQTGPGRRSRRENVRGAFETGRPVEGRVWLVDDVVTTGATLEACARALRRAGAQQVDAVVLARTPENRAQPAAQSR